MPERVFASRDDCLLEMESACRDTVTSRGAIPGRELEWPNLAYDARAAAELVASVERAASQCASRPSFDVVWTVLEPVSDRGQACGRDLECVPGLVCRPTAVGSKTKACTRVGSAGDPCVLDDECEAGLHCVMRLQGATCGPGLSRGESCSAAGPCADGLFCAGSSVETRACIPLLPIGERCVAQPTPVCEGQALCRLSTARPGYTCVAPAELGQPCQGDATCASGLCGRDPVTYLRVCVTCADDVDCARYEDRGAKCANGICRVPEPTAARPPARDPPTPQKLGYCR